MSKYSIRRGEQSSINIVQAWSKVLLTSAGLEDIGGNAKPNITACFYKMLDKPIFNIRVLFIPTAAINKVVSSPPRI